MSNPTSEPTTQLSNPTSEPTTQYEKLNEELNLALFCVLLVSSILMIICSVICVVRKVRAKQRREEPVCDFVGCCCGPTRLEKGWNPFRTSRSCQSPMSETKQFYPTLPDAGHERVPMITDVDDIAKRV